MSYKKTGKIINSAELSSSALRRAVLTIAESAYLAIDTAAAVKSQVKYNRLLGVLRIQGKKFSLKKYKRIRLVGIGKSAIQAAAALQEILGDKLSDGFVLDVRPFGLAGKVAVRAGTHPMASEINVENTRELLSKFQDSKESDLVIAIISGGGSALFCAPYLQSPEQQAEIFKAMTGQGASIIEINTVRKHLSLVKGGFFAKMLFPATVAALVFSDVPGDEIGTVASGPLSRDSTTLRDARVILEKYQVLDRLGRKKLDLLETPKESKYFENIRYFLLVSGRQALSAMRAKAEDLGFNARSYSDHFQGEARILGREIAESAKKGECLLGTGESTVHLLGQGLGGRNQEMCMGALKYLGPSAVFGCFASDGRDNTDAAGAVVDSSTLRRAKKLGLEPDEYLADNDSFRFLEATGDLVFTGPTGSNTADFFVCLKR